MPRRISLDVRVSPVAAEVALAAAKLFADTVSTVAASRGVARVAISGGSTPKTMFEFLADPSHPFAGSIPWSKLQLFWVDERCVPPTHPESNYGMTLAAMLSKVPLPAENVHRMEGELDPEEASWRYEAEIRNTFKLEGAETPTFDLILLGLGPDGHTASLFPHTQALNEMERLVVANHVLQKETWRITLTRPVINQGVEVAFLIEGAGKAQVLHDVFLGAYDPESKPSQLIRPASGRLTLLLDGAASAKLPATGADGVGTLEIS